MNRICVASTTTAWKMDGSECWWLESAEQMQADAKTVGYDLHWFLALEIDARGDQPFKLLLDRLGESPHTVWRYSIDNSETVTTTDTRLARICAGRNLAVDYAIRDPDITHILHLDTDLRVPGDTISKLLDVDGPIVGGEVPSYCLPREQVPGTRSHLWSCVSRAECSDACDCGAPVVTRPYNTAGFLLLRREVFRKVRWGTDHVEGGLSDDPWHAERCRNEGFGSPLIRLDVQGYHKSLVPVERRGVPLDIVNSRGSE